MAHFVLEYSDNLGETDTSIQALFKQLHDAAQDTQLFPYKGLRSRARCYTQYRLADGNPKHGFAHLEVKLGAGRSIAERQAATECFFAIFEQHFKPHMQKHGMALSYEMTELETVLKRNQNNIQDHL